MTDVDQPIAPPLSDIVERIRSAERQIERLHDTHADARTIYLASSYARYLRVMHTEQQAAEQSAG